MAQWLKRLFSRKTASERVIEFNHKQLCTEMENLSSRLSEFKDELVLAMVEEVILLACNIQLLEVNRYRTEKDYQIHLGRTQALRDLADYITRAKNRKPVKTENKKPRSVDQLRTRRTDNQAGIAI